MPKPTIMHDFYCSGEMYYNFSSHYPALEEVQHMETQAHTEKTLLSIIIVLLLALNTCVKSVRRFTEDYVNLR